MSSAEPNFVLMPNDEPVSGVDRLRRHALRLLYENSEEPEAPRQEAAAASPFPGASIFGGPRPARAVMIGLLTMPAVFVVVVLGALAMFGKPAAKGADAAFADAMQTLEQPSAVEATQPIFASALTGRPMSITLGDDARIKSIALDGDRVALHVEQPAGQEIVIYDMLQGRVVAAAPIETASVEAADTLSALTGPPPPADKRAATSHEPAAFEPADRVIAPALIVPAAPVVKPRVES